MTKPSKNPLFPLLIAATLLIGCQATPPNSQTTAASSSNASSAATPAPKDLKNVRVQLSFLKQSLDAPLIVAIEKGYFAEQGLNVTYERGFGNSDTISKLGSGKFDFAFSDLYSAMSFNDANPNDKIIGVAVTQNRAAFAIASLKEKGIADPKALQGKKMGAPAGDGPRKLFPLFAEQVGVDPNSINWTTMDPKLRENFLLQGKVDAISGFSTTMLPPLYKAGKKPEDLNLFYYSDNGVPFYGNAILVKEAYAKANPDIVKSFVRAYLKGLQDVMKDPTAGLDAVMASDESKLMDRTSEKTRLEIALKDLWLPPEVEQNGLGSLDETRLSKTIEQTVEGFKLKAKPAITDIFNPEFLPPKEERLVPPAAERKPLS